MTKVGAYAIIRVYTLVFPPDLAGDAGLLRHCGCCPRRC